MAHDERPQATAGGGANARFPIVGVGASAGGLAATMELLRHLGANPGLALMIVHHLDPAHESGLAHILSRVTEMPVVIAAGGTRVEPNHVYVLPPNAGVVLQNGALDLTVRTATGGLYLTIDQFFESLASDQATMAIGVLLSGNGFDGTDGIRAIKGAGGITFAQDASAEYRNLPASAIATGCVDFVLPPAEIARELVRIGAHPPAYAGSVSSPDFRRALIAMRKVSGIDFTDYKQTTLWRRLQRRMVLQRHVDLHEYVEYLERNPAEAAALCEEVLIHVTGFFRDPEMFAALKALVFPRILENRRQGEPIRIWIPGCSTGEEVYSIAITLFEFLADAGRTDLPVRIFGTDVSSRAIERARTGRYPESIERDVSHERLQRFFSKADGGYLIRKDIRDSCVFARHDVTRDPPFSGIDLVSCRNLLIYLGPNLQERILGIFHYALRDPGFLILGSVETVRSSPGFACIDSKQKIYARTAAAPRVALDFAAPQIAEAAPADTSGWQSSYSTQEVQREADRLVLSEFGPPGVIVTDDLAIIQFRGKTGPYLEPPPGVATFDLLRMAREELRLPLRKAIDEARTSSTVTRKAGLRISSEGVDRIVDVEVVPFALPGSRRYFLVLFTEATNRDGPEADTPARGPAPSSTEASLRDELTSTRAYLESVIERLEVSNEELKTANEEIISSNEELKSTNEELQVAKEALQAANEELRTVNEEMAERNAVTNRLNDDLTNVLNSVAIPIVLLARDSTIRRFTPAAGNLFRLSPADTGRLIYDFAGFIGHAELAQMIRDVLSRLTAVERTVKADDGRFYQLAVRPYVTLDNRIDGTVIVAIDVDSVKKGEQLLLQARAYAESIIDTVRECLVVLDADLRVRSTNRSFLETFRLSPDEVVGRHFCDLEQGVWDIPALRAGLERLCEGAAFQNLRVERDFPQIGQRVFLVDARRIEHTSYALLVLDDDTERDRAEKALQKKEIEFREMMLMTVSQAIIMIDETGRIVFANDAAARTFAYTREELKGMPVEALVPERMRDHHMLDRQDFMASASRRTMGGDRDLWGRRKDGTEFPIEAVLSVVERSGSRLAIAFITDVTEQREAERKIHDYQEKLQRMAFETTLAEDRERRRIASELHDQIGQSLALAQIRLSTLRSQVPEPQQAAIDDTLGLVQQSITDTRTLTFELSPPILYDLGLKEALSWLIQDLQRHYAIAIELEDDGAEKPLDDASAAMLFRSVRELLMNVLKHAATSKAKVALRRAGDLIAIDVEDGGVGFDPTEVSSPSSAGGFGLFSIQERISGLGGSFEITTAPQKGTRVSLRVPLKKPGHAFEPA